MGCSANAFCKSFVKKEKNNLYGDLKKSPFSVKYMLKYS